MGVSGAVDKIAKRLLPWLAVVGVHKDQLDLHALGDDAFDVDGGVLPDHSLRVKGRILASQLRKTREIGCQLHEDAVWLHASDDARHGLPGLKACRIFLPGTQKLAPRNENAPLLPVYGFYDHPKWHTHRQTLARMGNAGD